MIKSIISFLLLIFITTGAMAQVKFGVKAGVNIAKVTEGIKIYDKESGNKFKAGFHLGVVATQELSDFISLSTGLVYSQKGTALNLERNLSPGQSIDGYVRTAINYLEMPLNLEFKIRAVKVIAGPYFAYGIAGKRKTDVTGSYMGLPYEIKEESDLKFKNKLGESELRDDNIYARRADLGFNLGLGYEINNLLINVNYGISLSNQDPDIDISGFDDHYNTKALNSVISFGGTYYFGN